MLEFDFRTHEILEYVSGTPEERFTSFLIDSMGSSTSMISTIIFAVRDSRGGATWTSAVFVSTTLCLAWLVSFAIQKLTSKLPCGGTTRTSSSFPRCKLFRDTVYNVRPVSFFIRMTSFSTFSLTEDKVACVVKPVLEKQRRTESLDLLRFCACLINIRFSFQDSESAELRSGKSSFVATSSSLTT